MGAPLEKALHPGWSAHCPLGSLLWPAVTRKAWGQQSAGSAVARVCSRPGALPGQVGTRNSSE